MMQLAKTQKMTSKRALNGILLLDKPLAISSNGALQRAKRLLNAKKAGHTGSLDPLATGMLPLCFGEATKFSQYLLDADKHYVVTAKLGSATTTGDSEGEMSESCEHTSWHSQQILEIIHSFLGASSQIPPMYSALKFQGQPLYKLAREGVTIERPPRAIIIHQIQEIAVSDTEMSFRVHCSKGTYIRTLVEDIAKKAGTLAHITSLRRIGVGALPSHMISMAEIEDNPENGVAALIPVDHALAHFPAIYLSETESQRLFNGISFQLADSAHQGFVRLYSQQEHFLGLGEIAKMQLKSVRLINSTC